MPNYLRSGDPVSQTPRPQTDPSMIPPPREEAKGLDEYGLPMAWRHAEVPENNWDEKYWRVFEEWTSQRRLRSFPASPVTVALFLAQPPVSGRELAGVWAAIAARHNSVYWHEDALPIDQLHLGWGVSVSEEGVLQIEGPIQPRPSDP